MTDFDATVPVADEDTVKPLPEFFDKVEPDSLTADFAPVTFTPSFLFDLAVSELITAFEPPAQYMP